MCVCVYFYIYYITEPTFAIHIKSQECIWTPGISWTIQTTLPVASLSGGPTWQHATTELPWPFHGRAEYQIQQGVHLEKRPSVAWGSHWTCHPTPHQGHGNDWNPPWRPIPRCCNQCSWRRRAPVWWCPKSGANWPERMWETLVGNDDWFADDWEIRGVHRWLEHVSRKHVRCFCESEVYMEHARLLHWVHWWLSDRGVVWHAETGHLFEIHYMVGALKP